MLNQEDQQDAAADIEQQDRAATPSLQGLVVLSVLYARGSADGDGPFADAAVLVVQKFGHALPPNPIQVRPEPLR